MQTLQEQMAHILATIPDGQGGMVDAEYVVDDTPRCQLCGGSVDDGRAYCQTCRDGFERHEGITVYPVGTCPVCGRPANHDWQECARRDHEEWKAAQADRAAVLAELNF